MVNIRTENYKVKLRTKPMISVKLKHLKRRNNIVTTDNSAAGTINHIETRDTTSRVEVVL